MGRSLLTEVGVLHGLAGRQTGLVVVAQQLVQEVQRLGAHQVLVLAVDKPLPSLTRVPAGRMSHRDRLTKPVEARVILGLRLPHTRKLPAKKSHIKAMKIGLTPPITWHFLVLNSLLTPF